MGDVIGLLDFLSTFGSQSQMWTLWCQSHVVGFLLELLSSSPICHWDCKPIPEMNLESTLSSQSVGVVNLHEASDGVPPDVSLLCFYQIVCVDCHSFGS